MLICYGARMPSQLLMLHYGFIDPDNPNDRPPMEVMLPGARKIRMERVAAAGRALEAAGDLKAAWAVGTRKSMRK